MAHLVLGALIALVVGLTWLSSRRQERSTGCCAPADPRDDLRMRPAFEVPPAGTPDDVGGEQEEMRRASVRRGMRTP